MNFLNRLLALSITALIAACSPPSVEPQAWRVQDIAAPALAGSAQAHMAATEQSELFLSWLEPHGDAGYELRFSTLSGAGWSAPSTVAAGDNWFVNWADFPSVVPIDARFVVAHWLVLKPDQYYAYDIAYAISDDAGVTWSSPQVLNADTAVAEHGFVSFFPWQDGVGAVWLDGRRIAALSIDELFELEEAVGMSLRFALMDRSGDVLERGEIDQLVCDCCQTDAAATDRGPVVVYRDRSQAEVRDITVRRSLGDVQSGAVLSPQASWSEAVTLGPDNWVIDGCPVNGPAVAARDSQVVVAWFTAADDAPKIRFSRSNDGGQQFAEPVDLAGAGSFGQVDVVLRDGVAFVSWWQRSASPGMDLVVQRVNADDSLGEQRVISHTDATLPTDVPQMQFFNNQLYFAWSELGDDGGLYTAAAPLW